MGPHESALPCRSPVPYYSLPGDATIRFSACDVQSWRRSIEFMADHEVERASTTEGLPVSPSLGPALEAADVPMRTGLVDRRTVLLCVISVTVALAAGLVAQ